KLPCLYLSIILILNIKSRHQRRNISILLTNRCAAVTIFSGKNKKKRTTFAPERICYHESIQENLLQDLSDSTENSAAVPALSKAQNCRQCESPAGSHPKENMRQSPDHHRCRHTKTGADLPSGKIPGQSR